MLTSSTITVHAQGPSSEGQKCEFLEARAQKLGNGGTMLVKTSFGIWAEYQQYLLHSDSGERGTKNNHFQTVFPGTFNSVKFL